MSIEGYSLQIFRACNIHPQQLLTLLQPLGGRLPRDDQQFRDMATRLRQVEHIFEEAPEEAQEYSAALFQDLFQRSLPGAYMVNNTGSRRLFGNTAIMQHGLHASAPQTSTNVQNYGYQSLSEQSIMPTHNSDMSDDDDGTYTDTSSDDGAEDVHLPDMTHMTEQEAAERVYWNYRQAKRAWRRLAGKSVRRIRRIIKI